MKRVINKIKRSSKITLHIHVNEKGKKINCIIIVNVTNTYSYLSKSSNSHKWKVIKNYIIIKMLKKLVKVHISEVTVYINKYKWTI